MELTDVMTKVDLTDVYNTFHPNTEVCTFSSPHGTFSETDHILIHKASHSKYKKIKKKKSLYLILSPWNEAGFQEQKQQKAYKSMETEQLPA